MLVKNPARRSVQHSYYNDSQELIIVEIEGGEVKEIEDKIAKLWLKHGLVVEYVEPKKAKEEKEELLAKIAQLEAENKSLKSGQTEDKDEIKLIDALKKEADELGISYAKNIGIEKLKEKIDAFISEKAEDKKDGQTEDKE